MLVHSLFQPPCFSKCSAPAGERRGKKDVLCSVGRLHITRTFASLLLRPFGAGRNRRNNIGTRGGGPNPDFLHSRRWGVRR